VDVTAQLRTNARVDTATPIILASLNAFRLKTLALSAMDASVDPTMNVHLKTARITCVLPTVTPSKQLATSLMDALAAQTLNAKQMSALLANVSQIVTVQVQALPTITPLNAHAQVTKNAPLASAMIIFVCLLAM
jgi:hypothetical protein